MILINRITFLIVTILAISFCSSCDKTDDPSEEEIFLNKLSNTWTLTLGSATIDGMDATSLFNGMVITFAKDKTYSVQHSVDPVWPSSGTFILQKAGNGMYDIQRSDGVLITVSELTDARLKLRFQYTSSGGRSNGVTGQYEFIMNR